MLLGTNSYELFTMDKLCSKLVKHMQLMVQVRLDVRGASQGLIK